jgi:phospholipid/cholesterol/gamma-HCH transport system substrate-binding protein
LVKDLNAGKGTAGKLLKDEAIYEDFRKTLAKLNATTERVDTMLADAQNGKGTVGKLLTDDSVFNNINKVSDNINQISSEGTKMIYDFRQNPKKYLTIKFKLF